MSEPMRGFVLMDLLVLLAWSMAAPVIISDWRRHRRERKRSRVSDSTKPEREGRVTPAAEDQ